MDIEIDKHMQHYSSEVIQRVLQERLLNLEGIDINNLTDGAFKKITELKNEIEELRREVKGLRTRSITKKRLIKIMLRENFFTHKKKRLIRALSSCKPVSISTLRKQSTSKNVKSLKMLIHDTRKHISSHPDLKGAYSIINLKKSGQYQLLINPDQFNIVIK